MDELQLGLDQFVHAAEAVFDYRGILALDHEHRLFDFDAVYAERENRKWIKPELRQQLNPCGYTTLG